MTPPRLNVSGYVRPLHVRPLHSLNILKAIACNSTRNTADIYGKKSGTLYGTQIGYDFETVRRAVIVFLTYVH